MSEENWHFSDGQDVDPFLFQVDLSSDPAWNSLDALINDGNALLPALEEQPLEKDDLKDVDLSFFGDLSPDPDLNWLDALINDGNDSPALLPPQEEHPPPHLPEPSQNGGEVRQDLPDQQSKYAQQRKRTGRKRKDITLCQMKKHGHLSLKEAAKELKVHESTLKARLSELDMTWTQFRKGKTKVVNVVKRLPLMKGKMKLNTRGSKMKLNTSGSGSTSAGKMKLNTRGSTSAGKMKLNMTGSTSARKMKLNTSGSTRADGNQAGFGGLFTDDAGTWVGGYYGSDKKCDCIIAELLGLNTGLTIAQENEWQYLTVECDSEQVIEMINGGTNQNCLIKRSLVERIRNLRSAGHHFIQHIWSEGNQYADMLAKIGAEQNENRVDLNQPPSSLFTFSGGGRCGN